MKNAENSCCRSRQPARVGLSTTGIIVPGALLALMPKCPLCFVAWASALGLALPVAAADILRDVLLVACIAIFSLCLIIFIRSILINHYYGNFKSTHSNRT